MTFEASHENTHDSTIVGRAGGFDVSSHLRNPTLGFGGINPHMTIPHEELEQRLEVVRKIGETPVEDLIPPLEQQRFTTLREYTVNMKVNQDRAHQGLPPIYWWESNSVPNDRDYSS